VSFNLVTVGPWIEKGTDFDLHFRISKTGEGHRLLLANPKTNPAPLGTDVRDFWDSPRPMCFTQSAFLFLHSTDMLLVDFIKGLSPQEDIKFGIHEIEVALFPISSPHEIILSSCDQTRKSCAKVTNRQRGDSEGRADNAGVDTQGAVRGGAKRAADEDRRGWRGWRRHRGRDQ